MLGLTDQNIKMDLSELFDTVIYELCLDTIERNYTDLSRKEQIFYEKAFRAGMKYAIRHLKLTCEVMEVRP